jgi:hypothetical protein
LGENALWASLIELRSQFAGMNGSSDGINEFQMPHKKKIAFRLL